MSRGLSRLLAAFSFCNHVSTTASAFYSSAPLFDSAAAAAAAAITAAAITAAATTAAATTGSAAARIHHTWAGGAG